MMETKKFKFWISYFVLGAVFNSCSTPYVTPVPIEPAEVPAGMPLISTGVVQDIHAELSSPQVANGALLVVFLDIPTQFRGQPISATWNGVSNGAETQTKTEILFFQNRKAGETSWEALVGIPYEQKPNPAEMNIQVGERNLHLSFQIVDGQYLSESIQVAKSKVNPTRKSDLKRIIKEQAQVSLLYQKSSPHKLWDQAFQWPVSSRITSPFGTKRVYNGQLKHFHPGLDLKAAVGTPILAPAPGQVVMAKNLFYTGNTVILDHGFGLITLYAHMSKINVKVDQMVTTSDVLGFAGKTGRVTGPHLHWQALVNRIKINPIGLVQVLK